jgi:ATP synthase protein I
VTCDGSGPTGNRPDGLAGAARKERERRRRWLTEGEPSMARYVGQIGILGWMIAAPAVGGLFLGRWLDSLLGLRIFLSAPLLLLGVCAGFWSAWRWMRRQ